MSHASLPFFLRTLPIGTAINKEAINGRMGSVFPW